MDNFVESEVTAKNFKVSIFVPLFSIFSEKNPRRGQAAWRDFRLRRLGNS
jgi:hypothetical protein